MAHDLILGKTGRDWSRCSTGEKLPVSAKTNHGKIDHLIFNKWTAALLVGSVAASTLLITALRRA
jgi:hypothetical protein